MKNKKETQTEFDPYKVDKLARFPMVVKIILLKFWGAGATGYLVFLGLQPVGEPYLFFQPIVYWLVFALVLDLIINRVIRMMSTPTEPTEKYTMVSGTALFSILLNLLYIFIITFLITLTLYVSLGLFASIDMPLNLLMPLIYGLLFPIYDFIALELKKLLKKLINMIIDKRKLKEI